jgi:hypothetical protein
VFHPLAAPKRRRRRDDGAEDEDGGAKEDEGAVYSALPSLWGRHVQIASERLRSNRAQGAGQC